jgi:HPt (histidine-containing phosphotransfer) domain-containing protein
MDDLPVIDRARLQLITRNDAALADEFLGALIVEAAGLIEALGSLIGAGDHQPVTDIAHTLKGMSTEVGAMRLRAAAAALEADPEPEAWPDHFKRVKAALEELREV